jgi:glycosyltransferase involved in cell wall biosynthesis
MWPLKGRPNFGIFVKNFCDELVSRKFPFEIIYPEKTHSFSVLKYVWLWKRLAAYKETFDLLQVEYAFPTDLATWGKNRLKYYNKILVFHGSDLKLWRRLPFGQGLYQKMFFSCDAVVFPSKFALEEMKDIFDLSGKQLFVIPRGIDSIFLTPRNKEALRKEMGISDSDVVIVSVANFVPVKNHLTIFKALEKLNPPKRTQVIFVGDGPLRGRLEKYARKILKPNLNVVFVGAVDKREIIKYYDVADIFVTASLSEGYPVALQEAMARGLAIVASDIPAHREVLLENETGLFFPPQRDDHLSEILASLIEEERLREKLGEAACNSEAIWTMKRTVDEYIKVYNLFFRS